VNEEKKITIIVEFPLVMDHLFVTIIIRNLLVASEAIVINKFDADLLLPMREFNGACLDIEILLACIMLYYTCNVY